jgi:hypothetical protein
MDLMQALADHLAVVAMTLLLEWPLALAVVAIPLCIALMQRRIGGWTQRRRLNAARWGFVVGLAASVPLAFAFVGGGVGDLNYWLDWVFLAIVGLGVGGYVALVAYLLAGRRDVAAVQPG